MSTPSRHELRILRDIAEEIFETADHEGYTVAQATAMNAAFRDGAGPTSILERAILLRAAQRGASLSGVGVDSVAGGGVELLIPSESALRRYRVKRANKNVRGDWEIVCGAGSTLLTSEQEGLFYEERWIFGYTLTPLHTIDELFVAQILGHTGNGPMRLVLGPPIDIKPSTPPRGFTSTDEGLEGFDEDDAANAV